MNKVKSRKRDGMRCLKRIHKMKRKGTFLFLFLPLLLSSCGENQNQYSSVRCFVAINNQEHNDATLASAMNATSPGVFCLVQRTMKGGATYFAFKNNRGSQSMSIFNSRDQRTVLTFGYNNGVIVGFGNLDYPPVFYAYDNQCPNCFDWLTIPRRNYPLTLSSSGIATCNNCHREYNMNTGGNIMKGSRGEKNYLTRYAASTSGPFGLLTIH